jgi:putative transposase
LPTGSGGTSPKTVLTGTSKVRLAIPRDRAGTFDPQLIAKGQRRFPDFDDKIVSMYARGMSVRAIRDHLEELYGIDVSPDLISTVTDAVLDEVAEWQNRPLDACYPLVFFDAIRVKIRDEGFVRNKAVYIALGILPDGTREVLGLWIEQTEGAKFWLRVMNELKARVRHRSRTHGDTMAHRRRPDRGRGRAQRLPRGDRGGVPRGGRPDPRSGPGAGSASSI